MMKRPDQEKVVRKSLMMRQLGLEEVYRAVISKYNKLDGFKQQKFNVSQPKLKVSTKMVPFESPKGESVSCISQPWVAQVFLSL